MSRLRTAIRRFGAALGLALAGAALPAAAANYTFPGALPPGCSGSNGTYTCAGGSLAYGDRVTIASPKPARVTVNGDLYTDNAQINVGGSAADLTLVVTGKLTFGYQAAVVANIQANEIVDSSGAVTITGNVATTTRDIRLAWATVVNGSLTTTSGKVYVGNAGRVTGSVTSTSGEVQLDYAGRVDGAISTGGAVKLGQDTVVGGAITAATKDVEIGYAAQVGGSVSTSSGKITLAQNARVAACAKSTSSATITLGYQASASGVCCGGSCSKSCVVNNSTYAMPAACATSTAGNLLSGMRYSFESWDTPGWYVRHYSFTGYISPVSASSPAVTLSDATYIARPGLADPSCWSFESVNYPGHYLRHAYFVLNLSPDTDGAPFKADATFCARTGLAGSGTVSFESVNYPGYYLQHQADTSAPVVLATSNGSAAVNGRASFVLHGGWAGTAPATSPLVEYLFEQSSWNGTSGEVRDTSGNGYHATAKAGVSGSAPATTASTTPALGGSNGTCRYGSFTRNNHTYVAMPSNLPDITAGSFTTTFWVRSSNVTLEQRLFSDDANGVGYNTNISNTVSSGLRLRGSVVTGPTTNAGILSSNTWYFVAFGQDLAAGTVYLYAWDANGVVVAAVRNVYTKKITKDTGLIQLGNQWTSGTTTNRALDGFIDDLRIYNTSLSAAELEHVRQLTHACAPSGPDHYELWLPSTGLACLPSTVTVKACADSSSPCSNPYTAAAGTTATLSASAGTLGAGTATFDATGTATTTLSYPGAADGAAVTVTLSGEQTAATNARQCCPNGSSCSAANSCSTTFNTAGFLISASAGGAATTVPAQTAGTTSGGFVLRAVKTGTTTAACEAALTGATTVDWALQCDDPGTCASGNRMTLTGSSASAIASNPASGITSRTAVPMTFDANGNAPFTFNYADVGRVRLSASKTVNGAALAGASNAFVVKPAGFALSSIRQTASPNTANPGATSATGGVFVKAGEAFSATVTALTSSGATAPNFGRESTPEGVKLTATLALPAGGSNGTLANATLAGGSFTNGVATATTLAYSEVGVITLTPSVADGDYLGAGAVSGTASGNVGRFVPAKFALSGASVAHRSSLACTPASAFSYLGETFRLGFTLTAQNASGGTTANYTGAFARLDPASASAWQLAGRDGSTVFTTAGGRLSLGTATGSFAGGVAANVTLTAAALRASAPDGPFDAAFGVAPVDSDGVALGSLDMASTSGGANDRASVGSVALRFGRLRLGSAIGAADRALALPAWVQHWNGSAWATNTLDSCTTVAASAVSFGNLRRTLTTADTAATGPISFTAGVGSLRLAAPGGGRSGTVDVALSLGSAATDASCLQPWTPGSGDAASAGANLAHLRGAWCGSSFANDPSARASFGLQRTQDHLIFRRENY